MSAYMEVSGQSFRAMVQAVTPFVDPNNTVIRLSGIRFTTDGDVAVAEGVTQAGAIQVREILAVTSDEPFDQVLQLDDVEILVALVSQWRGDARVRLTHTEDAHWGHVVSASLSDSTALGADLRMATETGNGFPASTVILAALRDEAAEFELDVDALGRLTSALAPYRRRTCRIWPGKRQHVATAGDELIAVMTAPPAVHVERQRRFQTVPPPAADLDTWRARFTKETPA